MTNPRTASRLRDMAIWTPKEGWGERVKRLRAERRAAGLCTYCHRPAEPDQTRCEYHIAYSKKYAADYRASALEERIGFSRRVVIYLTRQEAEAACEFGDPATVLKSMAFQKIEEMKSCPKP